jgi:hypothetical protein
MIWIIIGVIVISLIVFGSKFNKDNEDLKGQTLYNKFKIIVEILNNVAFNGEGEIYELHKRSFNLGTKTHNQLINFDYGGGNLTITWKYKYFQKEVVNKKFFPNVRNLSIFEQERIEQLMIFRMDKIVNDHKNDVFENN